MFAEVIGSLEAIDADGNGVGWALARMLGAAPIEVSIEVDGVPSVVRAADPRPDVEEWTGVEGDHGFHFVLPSALFDGETHLVHAYAIGPKGQVELSHSPLSITLERAPIIMPPPSSVPIGALDAVDANGVATGWAKIPSRDADSIQVALHVDGGWVGTVATQDAHGFSFVIPSSFKDGNAHQLDAYGLGSLLFYAAADPQLQHQSGHAERGAWVSDAGDATSNYLTYGPYTTALSAGDYQAHFELMIDDNSDDTVVASIDVANLDGTELLAQRELKRNDFAAANAVQAFELPFTAPASSRIELRVFRRAGAKLVHVSSAIFDAHGPIAPVLLSGSPRAFQLTPPPPPTMHTKAQLLDTQGDLMIWGGTEFALDCTTGQDPETGIRCTGDHGEIPRGLQQGWVWSLSIPRYPPARRESLYQKILSYGYTHVAIQVTRCAPSEGYHGLYPVSADDCLGAGDKLNDVLREIRAHGLITWCTGITQNDPPEIGLDVSLCDLTLDDWDNTDQKDCHIDAAAQWFPDAWHFVELPQGAITPRADACTPNGLLPSNDGGAWIREAQRRDPRFIGMTIEINQPDGHDANLAELQQINAWWRDVVQNRFEIDTYWKFWDAYPFDESIVYNDWFIDNAPWLRGFMSGGTAHAPPSGEWMEGGFLGELDLHQAVVEHMPANFADWEITTHITRIDLHLTGVHVELDNGRPDAWPDTMRSDFGPILFSLGIAEKIGGQWYASAPIQLWRGLDESGGQIQSQDINDGTGRGQIEANWFYDGRWGGLGGYQPQPGETIGLFICAGDCRDGVAEYSPVHERSNVVLFSLPNSDVDTSILTVP